MAGTVRDKPSAIRTGRNMSTNITNTSLHVERIDLYLIKSPLFMGPQYPLPRSQKVASRLLLKCDGTRAETRFRLSGKRTSPFKSAGASVIRLLAAEVCASALVMLDTPCSEVV